MFSHEKFGYLDFDIYSRRISFYYKHKEKLGSTFGFILTVLYAIVSIILFLIYFIKTIKREEMSISDSSMYPSEIPSIELNNDLFYFGFGLEYPNNLSIYIDETIYYPEVLYIERKKQNGEFKQVQTNLNVERCDKIKFGQNYQKLFEKDELNNSYCVSDLNLTLLGSSKYENMSIIKINIYPCVNNSENKNHCKPKKVIDEYLSSTYFSVFTKDIGLNPFNYFSPTLPIIQNLHTSISKSIKKDYILFFGITQIITDIGLFSSSYKKENYLRYIKYYDNFIFNDNNLSKNEIISTEIILEDKIYCLNRAYTKMSQVFSTTGGYMQIIYTIFGLVVLLSKKISIEKKLLNSLFNFNINQRKIILCIEYEKKLDYNSSFDKGKGRKESNFIPYAAKKSIFVKNNGNRRYSHFNYLNMNKSNKNIETMKKSDTNQNIIPSAMKEIKKDTFEQRENFIKIFKMVPKLKIKKNTSTNIVNQSINRSKVNMLNQDDKKTNLNYLQLNNREDNKKFSKSSINLNIFKDFKELDKESNSIIKFNILDYYCFRKITKKRTDIELFNFGINFYKRQMDIINFFNIIILTQIMLTQKSEKKHNILSQKIELSIN